MRVQAVHQQPPQPVGHIDPEQHGLPALRVHRLPHQLVAAHEADQLVGEVLGGLQEGVVGLAGALCDTGAALGPGLSRSRSSRSPFPYRAGAGVGDTALVLYPAVVESFLVREGAAEGSSHGSHGVDADGRATEDTTVGKHRALRVSAAPGDLSWAHSHPVPTLSPVSPGGRHSPPGVTGIPLTQPVQPGNHWLCRCQSCGLRMCC